jgi:hypothetical protein
VPFRLGFADWPRHVPLALPQRAGQDDPPVAYRDVEGNAFQLVGFEDTTFRPLPGTVLGRAHGFGPALHDHRWRAVAVCGSFTVEIQGDGEPPARVDLDVAPARNHPSSRG